MICVGSVIGLKSKALASSTQTASSAAAERLRVLKNMAMVNSVCKQNGSDGEYQTRQYQKNVKTTMGL
jgi:hypothetical protein